MIQIHPLEKWHRLVRERDAAGLDELLADDVVFYSPILYKPQNGKFLTTFYLAGAMQVLGNEKFHYARELVGANDAVLEFETELDGIYVNGVDLLKWNDAGQVIEFKVMLRPLKAIQLVQQKMAELLESMGGM
jgi:hypothetical protein